MTVIRICDILTENGTCALRHSYANKLACRRGFDRIQKIVLPTDTELLNQHLEKEGHLGY